MGVNDAYRICEFLEILYAADGRWIDHHANKLPGYLREGGRCWTPDKKAAETHRGWSLINGKPRRGLSSDRSVVYLGNHGGYQLINFAHLMGCSTLILIGYDGRNGGEHWFGQHPEGPMRVKSNFTAWLSLYDNIAKQAPALGLTIINATPGSAISAFPKMDLSDALGSLGCLA